MADSDIPTDAQIDALAKEILAELPPGSADTSIGEMRNRADVASRYLSIVLEADVDGPSKLQGVGETTVDFDGTTVKVFVLRRVPKT